MFKTYFKLNNYIFLKFKYMMNIAEKYIF